MLKTRRKSQIHRIQLKYRAHNFENGFSAFPVPQNPMLEKRILDLSPIGKKLGGPYLVLGRHLGFWALDPPMDSFFSRVQFFLATIYFQEAV